MRLRSLARECAVRVCVCAEDSACCIHLNPSSNMVAVPANHIGILDERIQNTEGSTVTRVVA